MINFNEESNEEIIKSLLLDNIGRRKNLFNLIKLISGIKNNEIIALNGSWGSGKTFFIKQFELLINFINNYNENGELINKELKTNNLTCLNNIKSEQIEEINKIINGDDKKLRELFDGNQTNCLYFNAWEYDNNNEPILSIIYKIINDFPYLSVYLEDIEFKKITSLMDTVSLALSKGVFKASDYFSAKDLIEAINTSEEIKSKINEIFDKLLEENSNKMIIVIDELDRCKPLYAIKLLEEIKHYIKNKNVIVIITTNIQQLSNTIKNIYGYKFDVDEYLDKIIDITLSLPPIDKIKYIKNLPLESNKRSNNWFNDVITSYVQYRRLEMRSINRFITLMKLYENHIYLKDRRNNKLEYILEYIFLPYCLGEQIFNVNNYNDFVKGIGYEEFYKYIVSSKEVIKIAEYCFYSSTAKEERNLNRDLKTLYDSIYNQTQEYFEVKAGEVTIDNLNVKYFYDLCTMLSDFTVE